MTARVCLASAVAFTNVYMTENYADVVKIDKKASFAVRYEAFDSSTLIKSVRNNFKHQSIVIMLSDSFFNDNSYGINYKTSALKNNFYDVTGMPLQYVMTDFSDRSNFEAYVSSFRNIDVFFIDNFNKVVDSNHFPDRLTGINLIYFDNLSKSANSHFKSIINKNSISMKMFANDPSQILFRSYGRALPTAVAAPPPPLISPAVDQRFRTFGTVAAPPPPVASAVIQRNGSLMPRTVSEYRTGQPSSYNLHSNSLSGHQDRRQCSFLPTPSASSYSSSMRRNDVLTLVRPNGAFTLIFKGIQHYELINIFGLARNSSFLVSLYEFNNHGEIIEKALRDNAHLIWDVEPDYLALANRDSIGPLIASCKFTNIFILQSETIRHDLISAVSNFGAEIRVTSNFDPANVNNAQFRDFVLVDLTIGSAVNCLNVLGTKLADLDLEPFNFAECINPLTPVASPVLLPTNEKLNNVRQGLNYLGLNRLEISVSRANVFTDSFDFFRRQFDADLKDSSISVSFTGEMGYDAGGLTRDWFSLLSKQMFNPDYVLFLSSETNQNVFIPNKNSHFNSLHLDYFSFVGLVIGKGIIENIQLNCHFSRSVYKAMLSKQPNILDLREVDGELFQSLFWILENDVTEALAGTAFTVDIDVFGSSTSIDLRPNGSNELLTEANKFEYVRLMVDFALVASIRPQMEAFLGGIRRMISSDSISNLSVKQLEQLISGNPTIDVQDWRENTMYVGYSSQSPQIIWFWQAVETLSQAERRDLLQFATGSPSVPLEGFSHLRNRGLIYLFKISRDSQNPHNRLPVAHTCFNTIDLPVYTSYETLLANLRIALRHSDQGFGMA